VNAARLAALALALLLAGPSCSKETKPEPPASPDRAAICEFFTRYVDALVSTEVPRVLALWYKPQLDRLSERELRFLKNGLTEDCRQHWYLRGRGRASPLRPEYRVLRRDSCQFVREIAAAIGKPLDVVEIRWEILPEKDLSIQTRVDLVYDAGALSIVSVLPPAPVVEFLLQEGNGRELQARFPDFLRKLQEMEEELKALAWTPLKE
jgi:hypothetical protein